MMKQSFAVLGALILSCVAGAQQYAQRVLPVKAGILVIDSYQTSGIQANDTPHVWYNLDSNSRVKPAGWDISNPGHAPYSQSVATRWAILDPSGFSPPAASVGLRKQDSGYWEVFLSQVGDEQLQTYNILLLSAHGNLQLNTIEREKLRKFMDAGGVLWVDLNDGTAPANWDLINNFPIPFQIFNVAPSSQAQLADFFHPLMNYPFVLSQTDLAAMQSAATVRMRPTTAAEVSGSPTYAEQTIVGETGRMLPVAGDNDGTSISVGQVGDGFMVVTTRGVASTLNAVPANTSNRGFLGATPAFNNSTDAAAKLVVNMVNLGSNYPVMGGGSRMTNSKPVDISAPLLHVFSDTSKSFTQSAPKDYKPPVLYKGLLVITDNNRIYVYDADPKSDLDNDGNPDDGIVDYSTGVSYDLVWQSNTLSGPISSPTCIEVPQASGGFKDQILVLDAEDKLEVFQVFRTGGNLSAVVPDATVDAPADSGGSTAVDSSKEGPGPYAPTFHEGLIYIADSVSNGTDYSGRVWIVDPITHAQLQASGASGWFTGGVGNGVIPEIGGAAVVGYIPIQDNSGGLDEVVYVPSRPNPANPGPSSTAGITSLWMGAKGERPTSVNTSGTLTIATRAASQGLNIFIPDPTTNPSATQMALGVKLTVLDANGNPLNKTQLEALIDTTQNNNDPNSNFGQLVYTLKQPWPDDYSVRVDYHINWGNGSPGLTSQIMRGQQFLPDDADRNRRIVPNLALGPDGTLYAVTTTQDDTDPNKAGGSYFAFREEGRGSFTTLTRWDLYNQHTITLNDANDVTYNETLANTDPTTTLLPFLSGTLGNLTFISGPTVRDGVVYVTAQAINPSGSSIPSTILLAFDATPRTPEIKANDLGSGFTILQPDVLRSTSKGAPEVFNVLQPNQYTTEGADGAANNVLRLENLCSTNRGPMLNCLSTSQPVIIRRNGQPDQLLDPDRNGSHWSPLLWYTVFSGVGANASQLGQTGPPMVTGKTLFLPATSYLPSIISGGTLGTEGLMFALNTDIGTTDPYLASDPNRPWLKQLYQLKGTSISNVSPNPDVLWPQLSFLGDKTITLSDIRIRILQATLQGSSVAYGAIAGQGALYAWTNNGVWKFSKADFIVVDQGRIGRFDSSGNPIFSMDSTIATGREVNGGSAGNVHPIVNPTRAYGVGDRDLLIVDSGANRVVQCDIGGRETRSVETFKLDAAGGSHTPYIPEGFEANETLKLLNPRDALTFTEVVAAAKNRLDNAQPNELWRHFLIADTGNRRLLDVVDRYTYNPNTGQVGGAVTLDDGSKAIGVLNWHSPSTLSSKNYSYSSLTRSLITDSNGTRYVIAAGINNAVPTSADSGLSTTISGSDIRQSQEGNAGIIVFDGAQTKIINRVIMPAIAANVLYDNNSGTFDLPATATSERPRSVGAVNSVSIRNVNIGGSPQVAVMYTDASGVYEVYQNGSDWKVDWMLPREAYKVIRRSPSNVPTAQNPSDLLATYATRLESNEVLVVNGAAGSYFGAPSQPFTGEVLLLNGDVVPDPALPYGYDPSAINLGFSSLSIRFVLPPVAGTRGLVSPVFADRR